MDKQKRAQENLQEYHILMKERNDKHIKYAVAHFFELEMKNKNADNELNKILDQDKEDDELAEKYKMEIKQLKQREEQMKQENTARFKEKVDKAESVLKTEKKKLQEKETDVKTAKEALNQAKKTVKDAEGAKLTEEKNIQDFKNKSSKALVEFQQLQEEKKHAMDELEKAREQ